MRQESDMRILKRAGIILFWLVLWQLASLGIHNSILFAGPLETVRALAEMIPAGAFWLSVANSAARILCGLLLGAAAGIALGAVSYRTAWFRGIFSLFVTVLKAVPVVSFVILLLIWRGSAMLSLWISFLVVFPIFCLSTEEGLGNVDGRLKEAADVFGIDLPGRIKALYIPALKPSLLSALRLSAGMSFKSGAAAEVIGQPLLSMGNNLYRAKIYLDTAELFAWTAVIILVSWCAEKLLLCLAAAAERVRIPSASILPERSSGTPAEKLRDGGRTPVSPLIRAEEISKSFGDQPVLRNFSAKLVPGGSYLVTGESGIGKTTFLRILMGLESVDGGRVQIMRGESRSAGSGRVPAPRAAGAGRPGCRSIRLRASAVFQEDRLFEDLTAAENIGLVRGAPPAHRIKEELGRLLPEDAADRPVRELSGGQKRRVAIVRALLAESETVFMDEPFTGLDEENRRRAAEYIREKQGGRTLVVTGHSAAGLEGFDEIAIPPAESA